MQSAQSEFRARVSLRYWLPRDQWRHPANQPSSRSNTRPTTTSANTAGHKHPAKIFRGQNFPDNISICYRIKSAPGRNHLVIWTVTKSIKMLRQHFFSKIATVLCALSLPAITIFCSLEYCSWKDLYNVCGRFLFGRWWPRGFLPVSIVSFPSQQLCAFIYLLAFCVPRRKKKKASNGRRTTYIKSTRIFNIFCRSFVKPSI